MKQQKQINKIEWKEVALGDIFEFENKTGIKAGEGLEEGKYKFFTSSDNQSKFLDRFNFKGEHLIFSTGGKAGLHYCNEPFSVSNDCFIVEVKNHYTKFIYYLLKSKIYLLERGFKGAGLKHLSKDYLKKIKILLPFLPDGSPDLKEQERIVSIIKEAERLKEKGENAKKLLDEYLKSVFSEMFLRKEYPKERLENLCIIRRGASPRPIQKYLGGDVPWIKIGDGTKGGEIYVHNTKEKITKEGAKKSVMLKSGSFIFANCGVSLGFSRIIKFDGCIHDGWLSFADIDKSKLNEIYLLKLINSLTNHLRKIAPDGTQPNLNTGIMKKLEIPLPPLPLQEKFSRIVEHVEKMKENLKRTQEKSEELFNSLMTKAFRGEL